ncbi:MAG TPA: C2H2-type zinc finger protein [Myxococcota bacterium]|nr:C2H2-type zinc finger protein [Myxococcota bacterium]
MQSSAHLRLTIPAPVVHGPLSHTSARGTSEPPTPQVVTPQMLHSPAFERSPSPLPPELQSGLLTPQRMLAYASRRLSASPQPSPAPSSPTSTPPRFPAAAAATLGAFDAVPRVFIEEPRPDSSAPPQSRRQSPEPRSPRESVSGPSQAPRRSKTPGRTAPTARTLRKRKPAANECRIGDCLKDNGVGESFSRPYDLTRHINTVHGQPLQCLFCERAFRRHDARLRHMRARHADREFAGKVIKRRNVR